jgi:hypothetical protein
LGNTYKPLHWEIRGRPTHNDAENSSEMLCCVLGNVYRGVSNFRCVFIFWVQTSRTSSWNV